MCNLKVLALLFASVSHAAAKGLSPAVKVQRGFGGGVGSTLKDDFALMEDEFEAPSDASLTSEAAVEVEEVNSVVSASKPSSDVDVVDSEKKPAPFLLTLVLDLLILAVVAHGFQRSREEYMGAATKKSAVAPVAVVPLRKKSCRQESAASLAAFKHFARAVQTGDEATCLRLLKEAPDLLRSSDSCGCSALHLAAHEGCMEVLRRLLQLEKSSVNARDSWDETPLHFAARAGQVEACRELLAAGCELEATNLSERNAVLVAAEAKQEAVCRFLLEQGATAGDVEDDELPPLLSTLVFERMLLATASFD